MVRETDVIRLLESAVGKLLGAPRDAGRIVAGLSGGADSVALVVAMCRLGYDVAALHCNYHLRGEESDADELHVRRLCERLEIPLTLCGLDVAAEALRGESMEMTCRRLRYALFASKARETGATTVAVAHHRDDNVETFVLNLMRSAGIAGLKAMLPVAPLPGDPGLKLVRPLLECTRAMTEEYLQSLGIGFVVDSTNLECDYTRNRVRNRVLPAIRNDFPDADAAVAASAGHLREAYGFVEEMIDRLEEKFATSAGIDVASVVADMRSSRFALYSLLARRGFSAAQTDDVLQCVIAGQSGRRFRAVDGEYLLDRGVLRAAPAVAETCRFRVTVEKTDAAGLSMERSNDVAYFDAAGWENGPAVEWRPWRQGDTIAPLGMRGTKKLSDVFNDAKTPADVKSQLPLAVKGGEVLWVPGIKRSRRLTLTADTREVIVCRLYRVD